MKVETETGKKKFKYQEKMNAYMKKYYLKNPDKREKQRELNLLNMQKIRREMKESMRYVPLYMKNKIIKEIPVFEEEFYPNEAQKFEID